MEVTEAQRLRSLEAENSKLKRLVADQGYCSLEGYSNKKVVSPKTAVRRNFIDFSCMFILL